MKITIKKLNKIIKEEIDKIKDEQDQYKQIEKLIHVGEKIESRINLSLQHLKSFMNLGNKVRDPFEFKRAIAEIKRIITLATDYQTLIISIHENAEKAEQLERQKEFQEEKLIKQVREGGLGSGRKPNSLNREQDPAAKKISSGGFEKPKKDKYGLQIYGKSEYEKPYKKSKKINESFNVYGCILSYNNSLKNKEIIALNEEDAKKKLKKEYPLYEIKKIVLLKENKIYALTPVGKKVEVISDPTARSVEILFPDGHTEWRFREQLRFIDIDVADADKSNLKEGKEFNKVYNEIEKLKKKLIEVAKIKGIYENFGQKEVKMLEDKYINQSDYSKEMNDIRNLIQRFNDWCSSFDLSKVKSMEEQYQDGIGLNMNPDKSDLTEYEAIDSKTAIK